MRVIAPQNNWGWQEVLLNKAVYYLNVLAWQQTKDGQSKTPKNSPEMFMPDFMKVSDPNKDSQAYTSEEIDAILAKPRQ